MRAVHFHLGLDEAGDRHKRLRSTAEMRRAGERRRLRPVVVLIAPCQCGRVVWRNGLHRRRWLLLTEQARGDRRCFLMTLSRPPLVRPLPAF